MKTSLSSHILRKDNQFFLSKPFKKKLILKSFLISIAIYIVKFFIKLEKTTVVNIKTTKKKRDQFTKSIIKKTKKIIAILFFTFF